VSGVHSWLLLLLSKAEEVLQLGGLGSRTTGHTALLDPWIQGLGCWSRLLLPMLISLGLQLGHILLGLGDELLEVVGLCDQVLIYLVLGGILLRLRESEVATQQIFQLVLFSLRLLCDIIRDIRVYFSNLR